jgi:protease-4
MPRTRGVPPRAVKAGAAGPIQPDGGIMDARTYPTPARHARISRLSCLALAALAVLAALPGCSPRFSLFKDHRDPLKEYTLEGKGGDRVLLLPVQGLITSQSEDRRFGSPRPSLVQEVVSQLDMAAKDERVKAVLLKIDSPGGTTAASDLLYHEIERYKARTKAKEVTIMMTVAASGGYYAALASDRIMAMPMTVTGSVGTIFIEPKVYGLLDKIGVQAQVARSGRYKDMVSPLRPSTPEERQMVQDMIDDSNGRFLGLVAERRSLSGERLDAVATARVYTARQALDAGLVDGVGYLDDALAEARKLAGLADDARLVVYRRVEYPNDNPYNSHMGPPLDGGQPEVRLELPDVLALPKAGLYYLWAPELE